VNREQRRRRVEALVAAARALAGQHTLPGRALRPALAEPTGLSPEGIDLALREHLEIEPSPAEIDALVAAAGEAPSVQLVLSANVFVGALRAIALAAAAAPRVLVRPSRREGVFAAALLDSIEDRGVRESIRIVADLAPCEPGEQVHLYGSDDAVRQICEGLPRGTLVRAHATGMGIALVGARVDLAHAAERLARDIVPFDQRGCLSPRIAIAIGPASRARALAVEVARSLAEWSARVPTGRLDPLEREQRTRFRDLATVTGEVVEGVEGVVAVVPAVSELVVPPPGRNLAVVACADASAAATSAAPLGRYVTALGCCAAPEEVLPMVAGPFARVRNSELGVMQRPPFDGPVDLRTVLERAGDVARGQGSG
jgi:hypothetical protein